MIEVSDKIHTNRDSYGQTDTERYMDWTDIKNTNIRALSVINTGHSGWRGALVQVDLLCGDN